MRTALVGVSLAVLAACTPLPQLRPVMVQGELDTMGKGKDYDEGKTHLAAGRLGLAVERFRAAIARDRADLAALNALAACYDRLGRFDLADRYYDQALAMAPQDAQTLNNMAVSNLMRGRTELALVLLGQARGAEPENPIILANLERAAARPAEPEAEPGESPPARIQRAGLNAWAVHTKPLQPVSWVRPASLKAEEPPPPMAAPRPAITREDLAPPTAAAVVPRPASLQVVNGAGKRGMAARMRAFLADHGVTGTSIADAPRFDHIRTTLSYPAGSQDQAAALARLLPPGVKLEAAPAARQGLVLILGNDLIPFDQTQQRGRS